MRYLVERNFVQVIGTIWMPAATCAMEYPLTAADVETIGLPLTRENVAEWLTTHSGDFQSIEDFRATIGDEWCEWEHEESELTFNDCMFPAEEEAFA